MEVSSCSLTFEYSPFRSKITCPTFSPERNIMSAMTLMVLDFPILVLPNSAVRFATKSWGETLIATACDALVVCVSVYLSMPILFVSCLFTNELISISRSFESGT